ncbi:hypothetical protein LAG90_14520 [Marinilongibacter aquaticus]|uniref:hypothetical protein n=1 Tax=Marinilongibacter aquaticus TaxID=2975157 RepID=UPI0021BD8F40|nr:hypothetical protein [Marinilongibacter aquaticus]UBM58019.1 hypothetical protein LAG90_14520 [Marinilongibacter aquaticus]
MSEHLNDLREIRKMMEKSSRFLSLSGISGIAMGIIALASAAWAYVLKLQIFSLMDEPERGLLPKDIALYVEKVSMLAVFTLLLALITGFYFTYRKARHRADPMWNSVSKKLMLNLSIPLLAGGLLVVALLINKTYWPIPEIMLIFYGLALINASHFTYRDVYYLGLLELLLGLIALFVNGYSLLFWALGFGVLHMVYGISMYLKYDRKN